MDLPSPTENKSSSQPHHLPQVSFEQVYQQACAVMQHLRFLERGLSRRTKGKRIHCSLLMLPVPQIAAEATKLHHLFGTFVVRLLNMINNSESLCTKLKAVDNEDSPRHVQLIKSLEERFLALSAGFANASIRLTNNQCTPEDEHSWYDLGGDIYYQTLEPCFRTMSDLGKDVLGLWYLCYIENPELSDQNWSCLRAHIHQKVKKTYVRSLDSYDGHS